MIPRGSKIVCSNEECAKELFKLTADLDEGGYFNPQNINCLYKDRDKMPALGEPIVCPYCACRFLIEEGERTKLHTHYGWEYF